MDKLGLYLLWFTLILSVYSGAAAVIGDRTKRPDLVASARQSVYAVFLLVSILGGLLIYAFVTDDFSLKYVAGHSSRVLHRAFAATALWSGMEGSLTFWSFILAGYTAVVVFQNRHRNKPLVPYVILTLMIIQAFFIYVQIFLANPFEPTLGFIPADGRGLNPQLQNPGMTIHPPMLYLGYVGCAIPFAFAMASLFTNRLDDQWIRTTRRWTIVTWTFLSVGILLGGWWAYVELGWGGYWAWDPVENASLMPWLTATAYLHSVMIQEKRDMLKIWNMVLVFLTFFLSVMGTFLTRSGFVQSVHSFTESSIGWYFLGFLGILLIYFLVPFLYRLKALRSPNQLDSLVSKEASFLYNNWLFLASLVVVLVGTLGEPVSKLIQGVSTTFRAPYFNALNIPIGLMLLFLTGVGPLIAWRRATPANLTKSFTIPMVAGGVLAVGIAIVGYALDFLDLVRQPAHRYAFLTFFLCGFVTMTIVQEFHKAARSRTGQLGGRYLSALAQVTVRNGRRFGGYIVHLAVVAAFAGFAGQAFNQEVQRAIKPGETMSMGRYTMVYVNQQDTSIPTYAGLRVRLDVYERGDFVGAYGLEKRFYYREEQPTTEVAIRATPIDDLYMFLVSVEQDGSAVVKVHLNPLVSWVWFGGFMLAFGSLIAMWPTPAERRAMALDAVRDERLAASSA